MNQEPLMSRRPIAAVLLAAIASISSAQVTRDTARLETVVVTATRNPLAIGDVPASVTVLDGADLRLRGIVSVTDALREVPGIAIARTGSFGGTTSLFVRGGQSNYTKVLIDGVPVNQSGGAFDFSTLTTDNVERIEIVRGPSSVVWGSDAVTGVINVITRSGRGGPRLSASLRGGSFGTVDADAQVSHASPAATWSMALGHHGSTGIYDFNNRHTQTVFSGRADAAVNDKTDGSFTIRYLDHVAHYPTDGTGAAVDSNAFNLANQLALSARMRRLINSRWSIAGTLTSSAHDGGTDDAAGQGSTNLFQTLDHITRRGAEVRAIGSLGDGLVMTFGGQLEEQAERRHQQSSFFGSPISSSLVKVARHDRAAFGEAVLTTDQLTATVGMRVDGNEQFGTFGTYRAAAQYALTGSTTIRGSVGTAFREPSLSENFAAGFVTGNPDLKPEHTQSWEVGFGTEVFDQRIRVQAVYFDQEFVNLIDYNGAVPAGQPNYENIARASSRGAEVEIRHAPLRGFVGELSLTRLETEVLERGFSTATTATLVEGGQLLRRPRLSGSARLGYTGIERLRADVAVTHVGEREDRQFSNSAPFTAAVTLPAYTLVDISGEYRLPSARAEISLTARAANVGDVQYQSVAGYKAPGRTILGGVRIAY
jgi:vitamin B12 transporter